MVKKNNFAFLEFFKVFYSFKLFQNKFNIKDLIIFDILILLLLSLLLGLRSNIAQFINFFSMFFGIFFLFPLFLLLFYFFFYVFLRAITDKVDKFFESYLVFTTILLPFVLVLNFLTFLSELTYRSSIVSVIGLLTLVLSIYLLVNFIISFKNYLNVHWTKVFSIFLVISAFIYLISLSTYVFYLLGLLK